MASLTIPFKHESGDENGSQSASGTPAPQFQPMATGAGGATPGGRVDVNVIEEILSPPAQPR